MEGRIGRESEGSEAAKRRAGSFGCRAAAGDPDQRYAAAIVVAEKDAAGWSENTVLDAANLPDTKEVQVLDARFDPKGRLHVLFALREKDPKTPLKLKHGTKKIEESK